VPFKNGETYSDKPPLLFWLYHLGWAIFGVNDWWPRLISPLFSLGTLALTWRLARRLWPDRPAIAPRASWILASMLLWMLYSSAAMFDILLAFFAVLGIHGVVRAAQGRHTSGMRQLGVAIGLGVLAKGPAILLHVLPVALLAFWWQGGLNWPRWYGSIVAAVLLGALIALAWALPAGFSGGEAYQNAIFWGQTADRMVSSFAHRRPFWWYVPLLPVLLFPWLCWPPLWRAILRTRPDAGLRFGIVWAVPVFLAFSLVSGKQPHYLLPIFPALALYAARVLEAGRERGVALPALLTGGAGLALIILDFTDFPAHAYWQGYAVLWPGIVLIVGALLLWRWSWQRPALPALAGLGLLLLSVLQLGIVRPVSGIYDVRPLAEAIARAQHVGTPVAHAGKYHAQYQFAGRLRQPLTVLPLDGLTTWFKSHPGGLAVVYVRKPEDLDGVPVQFRQLYRSRVAALVDAEAYARLLARQAGRAGT
jgi:4-amino-4-deoxy-L-arabinose transferase-like glycosyltransferase